MTRHLHDVDFVEALDGVPSAPRDAHLAQCTACSSRLQSLRDAMAELQGIGDVPEPSPFFWEHFSRRVHDAVRADALDARGFGWWRPARVAALATAAVVAIAAAVVLLRDVRPSEKQNPAIAIRQESPVASEQPLQDVVDLDSDSDWALVRAVADDLHWEDAPEAGIHARPGVADRVAVEMSAEERQELARLLEDELKRTGA